MNVLWCMIKTWKRCAVSTAIASCCHESMCALLSSRPALTRHRAVQLSAFCLTVLRHAGAFEKSKIQEWPVDGFSESGLCAGLLREHVRRHICKSSFFRTPDTMDTRVATRRRGLPLAPPNPWTRTLGPSERRYQSSAGSPSSARAWRAHSAELCRSPLNGSWRCR